MILVYSFPLYVPVTMATIENMNWGSAIVGATILFPGIWWIVKARKIYIKEHNSVVDDNVVIAGELVTSRDVEASNQERTNIKL
jgi:choline transport protein